MKGDNNEKIFKLIIEIENNMQFFLAIVVLVSLYLGFIYSSFIPPILAIVLMYLGQKFLKFKKDEYILNKSIQDAKKFSKIKDKILTAFNNGTAFYVSLPNNLNYVVSKNNGWEFKDDLFFVKGDMFLTIGEVIKYNINLNIEEL